MTSAALERFITESVRRSREHAEPADWVFEEHGHLRLSPDRGADSGIELARGGVILLSPGAVTSFVPNPDNIHVTGVPADRPRAGGCKWHTTKAERFSS